MTAAYYIGQPGRSQTNVAIDILEEAGGLLQHVENRTYGVFSQVRNANASSNQSISRAYRVVGSWELQVYHIWCFELQLTAAIHRCWNGQL